MAVLTIGSLCTNPAMPLKTASTARICFSLLGLIVQACQGSVGSIERALRIIVLVEHQWLRTL